MTRAARSVASARAFQGDPASAAEAGLRALRQYPAGGGTEPPDRAAWQGRGCWRTCWCRSIAITCRCIGRKRSMRGRESSWTAQRRATRRIARANIPRRTWAISPAHCKPTAKRATIKYTKADEYRKPAAGHMGGGNFTTWRWRTNRRWHGNRWSGSRNSTRSRSKSAEAGDSRNGTKTRTLQARPRRIRRNHIPLYFRSAQRHQARKHLEGSRIRHSHEVADAPTT